MHGGRKYTFDFVARMKKSNEISNQKESNQHYRSKFNRNGKCVQCSIFSWANGVSQCCISFLLWMQHETNIKENISFVWAKGKKAVGGEVREKSIVLENVDVTQDWTSDESFWHAINNTKRQRSCMIFLVVRYCALSLLLFLLLLLDIFLLFLCLSQPLLFGGIFQIDLLHCFFFFLKFQMKQIVFLFKSFSIGHVSNE